MRIGFKVGLYLKDKQNKRLKYKEFSKTDFPFSYSIDCRYNTVQYTRVLYTVKTDAENNQILNT